MSNTFFNKRTLPLLLIFFLFGAGFSYLFFQFDQSRIQSTWQTRSTFSYLFILESEKGAYWFSQLYVYNTETQKSYFIDLPAETAYEKRGSSKISWLGKLYEELDQENFLACVSGLIGEAIDFCFTFKPSQLAKTVDLLSGIPLFIDCAVDETVAERQVLIPSGHTVLDGEKANEYIFYFKSLPYHTQRQAFFQSYLNSWLEEREYLLRPEVMCIFYGAFRNNLRSKNFLTFLLERWVSPKEDSLFFFVKGPMQHISEENIDIIFPTALSGDSLLKEQMRRGLRYVNDYNKLEEVSIEVLNGTTKTGLAKKVGEAMEYQGYRVLRVGNTEHLEERSAIITNKGSLAKARIFSELLRIDNIRRQAQTDVGADVTIILGSDFNEQVMRE